jgi:hypothetical protein
MARILERAAALQAVEGDPRLTLDEIAQVAHQVGIPRVLIEQAATELPVEKPGGLEETLLGPSPIVVAGTVIEGRMDDEQLPGLIGALRETTGREGSANQVGPSLEWHDGGAVPAITATIVRSQGATTIRIRGDATSWRNGTYLIATTASGLGVFFAILISTEPAPPANIVPIMITVAAGLLAGARLTWNYLAQRARQRVERVRDTLSRLLRDLAEKP